MLLTIHRHRAAFSLANGRQLNAIRLELIGKVEATTIDVMQAELEPICQKDNMHVLIDMSAMEYTTSTGMGAMVQYASLLEAKGGRLSLLAPSEPVRQVIELLGLQEILSIFKDDADLCLRYSDSVATKENVVKQEQIDLAVHRAYASVNARGRVSSVKSGSWVLGMPEMNFFFTLLKEKMEAEGLIVHAACDNKEVWKMVQACRPSVLLVDYSLENAEDLCMSIKSQAETSACSIVRVYPESVVVGKSSRLTVIPNEFVREPCSLEQLLNFVKSEIERHRSESSLFQHELFFSFPSEVQYIEKTNDLLERLLIKAFKGGGERLNGFIAAVREAIDNAKRHGHSAVKNAHVRILYLRDEEKISISVKDEGPGFTWQNYVDAAAQSSPIALAQSRTVDKPGGLGIALMRRACDVMRYNDSGNEITLTLLRESVKK